MNFIHNSVSSKSNKLSSFLDELKKRGIFAKLDHLYESSHVLRCQEIMLNYRDKRLAWPRQTGPPVQTASETKTLDRNKLALVLSKKSLLEQTQPRWQLS